VKTSMMSVHLEIVLKMEIVWLGDARFRKHLGHGEWRRMLMSWCNTVVWSSSRVLYSSSTLVLYRVIRTIL
jgi:hypothetical protein